MESRPDTIRRALTPAEAIHIEEITLAPEYSYLWADLEKHLREHPYYAASPRSARPYPQFLFEPKTTPRAEDYSAQRFVKDFFVGVITGNPAEVEVKLTHYPKLLLFKATLWDLSNRRHVNRYAFQLMVAAEDEMYKMAERFFDLIPNGNVEKVKQFCDQFPEAKQRDVKPAKKKKDSKKEGFPSHEKLFKKKKNLSPLEKLFVEFMRDGLIRDGSGVRNETYQALRAYLNHVTEQNVIGFEAGLHNDMHIFEEALAIYAYYSSRIVINKNQQEFYFRMVLGALEAEFTVCWLQTCNQGLRHLFEEDVPPERSLELKTSPGNYLLPQSSNPDLCLGRGLILDIYNGGPRSASVSIDANEWLKAVSALIYGKRFERMELEKRVKMLSDEFASSFLDDRVEKKEPKHRNPFK